MHLYQVPIYVPAIALGLMVVFGIYGVRLRAAARDAKKDVQTASPELLATGIEKLDAALFWSRITGDFQAQADLLNATGVAFVFLKNESRAVEALTRALSIAERLHDGNLQCSILDNLGSAKADFDFSTSKDYYDRAIILAEQLNNSYLLSRIWCNLGVLYKANSKRDEAKASFEKAVERAEQSRNSQQELLARHNLGLIDTPYDRNRVTKVGI